MEQFTVTGYQTISEYGREDECYFEEDGRLVMDAETAESVTENDSVTEHDTEESGNTKAGSELADTQPDTEKQADRRKNEYGK